MEAGAEIDDQVEVRRRKREPPHVARNQLRPRLGAIDPAFRLIQQLAVDVEPHQPGRRETSLEDGKRDSAAAADLEQPSATWKAKGGDHQRYLDVLLAPVPRRL